MLSLRVNDGDRFTCTFFNGRLRGVGSYRIDLEQDKYVLMMSDEDNRAQKYPFLKDRPVQYYFMRFMENRREQNDYVCVLEDNQEPVDFHRTVNSFNQCPLTLKGTCSRIFFLPL